MKIKYSPQFNEHDQLAYHFDDELISVTLNDQTETFDFTNMPNGRAEKIESEEFTFCPIISAERKEGTLYLELLNFIGLDATEEEKFPEWQEVKLDGED